MIVSGDDLPADVEQHRNPPGLALERRGGERRTKQVEVRDPSGPAAGAAEGQRSVAERSDSREADERPSGVTGTERRESRAAAMGSVAGGKRISRLLDETARLSWVILLAIAAGLGAAHAIQPGHGKTLVTAVALGPGARLYQPALLGLATTLAHTGSVLLVAAALWYTGATRVGTVHAGTHEGRRFRDRGGRILARGPPSGWVFGARVEEQLRTGEFSNRGLVGLGLAGGLVPCWDAVGLLVLAAAVGRLAAGVGLVLAFSAGMAAVLVAVGWLAWKMKSAALGT